LLQCPPGCLATWHLTLRPNRQAKAVERELRSEPEVAVSQSSGLFLLLLRCALPRLDAKRARKMAAALEFADHHAIRAKRLSAFLWERGGIEGAARGRARLRDQDR
jgi:hypothetical protein